MNYEALALKIKESDITELSDQEIVDILTDKTIPVLGKAPLWQVKQRAIETGAWWLLKQAIKTESSIQHIADAAITLFEDMRFDNIDMTNPMVLQMCVALIQAGIITQELFDEIMIMATTYVSWAEQNGWPEGIAIGHVESARSM
jgi:hypothetical protein